MSPKTATAPAESAPAFVLDISDAQTMARTVVRASEPNPFLDVVKALPVVKAEDQEITFKSFKVPGTLEGNTKLNTLIRQLREAGVAAGVTVRSPRTLLENGAGVEVKFYVTEKIIRKAAAK
jgi:hypothetical protein